MNKAIYILLSSFVMMLSVQSCTKNGPETESDAEQVEYGFTLTGTKSGDASSTTYRAMLLNIGGNVGEYLYNKDGSLTSGTYRGPNIDERAWLTACEVIPISGEWRADTHKYGLRAGRNKYFLSFVSPAVAAQQYKLNPDTGKYEEWGFLHHRDPKDAAATDPHEPVSISSPILLDTLTGNHINNQYVYDVPDEVVLKERRAKVILKLKCGNDLPSATVSKVSWSNIYQSAYYNLRLAKFDTFTLTGESEAIVVLDSPLTVHPGEDPKDVDDGKPFYLFPLKYTQQEAGKFVYAIPQINITVAQRVAVLQVLHELKPQYTYTYTITINSAYVNLAVTAEEWDKKTGTDTVDTTPGYSTDFSYEKWADHSANGSIDKYEEGK